MRRLRGMDVIRRGEDARLHGRCLYVREGVARVIETMRACDAVPAGMKIELESVYDNRYVLNALGR
jgi:hypothetical protein